MKTITKVLIILTTITTVNTNLCKANENPDPKGLVFRIEVILDNKMLDENTLQKMHPITGKNYLNETLLTGAWCDYLLAQQTKNELKEKGYSNTQIKPFFNNQEISLTDAFELLNNRNVTEEKNSNEITKEQIELLLQEAAEKTVYYKLQVGVYNGKNADLFLDLLNKYKMEMSEWGVQSYALGKFFGYNEANDLLKILSEEGLADITIIAFNAKNEPLPLERAQQIEQDFVNEKLHPLAKK